MRVLVACEFSGIVRNAFLRRGHNAWSCDLLPTEGGIEDKHWVGDVRELLTDRWDLVIAHPPCTYLCNSGRRWFKQGGKINKDRELLMLDACLLFLKCYNANSPRICVENPIMMKEAMERIGAKYTQIIHPWQFGHNQSKSTCLWLKGLPSLLPTKIVDGRSARVHKMPPGPRRARMRSMTYHGIAEAMAEQWG